MYKSCLLTEEKPEEANIAQYEYYKVFWKIQLTKKFKRQDI